MLKKFLVISKRYNLECEVECNTAQEAQALAASVNKAFVLTSHNPLTVKEV